MYEILYDHDHLPVNTIVFEFILLSKCHLPFSKGIIFNFSKNIFFIFWFYLFICMYCFIILCGNIPGMIGIVCI